MRISVEKVTVEGPNKKIALLTDIHYYRNYNLKRLDLLLKQTKLIEPDYICMVGDLIDNYYESSYKEIEIFNNWIKQMGDVAPVIIVLGNHEYQSIVKTDVLLNQQDWIDTLNKIDNVKVLDNSLCELSDDIVFHGFNPLFTYYCTKEKDIKLLSDEFNKKMPVVNEKKYNILLVHSPLRLTTAPLFNDMKLNRYNLILSGHTHGGLVPNFIKGNQGLISPCKDLIPRNVRGHIKRGNTNFVISHGVIKFSNSAGPFEIFNDIYPMNIGLIKLDKSKENT